MYREQVRIEGKVLRSSESDVSPSAAQSFGKKIGEVSVF